MGWVLALSLASAPDGLYTRTFTTEAQCVKEMNEFIQKNRENPLVNGIACLNQREFDIKVTG